MKSGKFVLGIFLVLSIFTLSSIIVSAQLSYVSSEIIYDESRLSTLDFSGLGFVSANISDYQFTPRTSGNDDFWVAVYETEEELNGDDFDSIINKQVEVSRNHGNELSVLNAGTLDFYYYRLTGEFAPCDECDVESIDYGYIYWISGVNSVVFSLQDFSFLGGNDRNRYDEIVSLVNYYREIYPVEGDYIKPTEEPVDLPEGGTEEDMVLICAGCVKENKCFPMGYRTDVEYCSGDEAFILQKKSDASCNNNFECSTNLCIDNECVSSGFWQKIIRFFKNLFG